MRSSNNELIKNGNNHRGLLIASAVGAAAVHTLRVNHHKKRANLSEHGHILAITRAQTEEQRRIKAEELARSEAKRNVELQEQLNLAEIDELTKLSSRRTFKRAFNKLKSHKEQAEHGPRKTDPETNSLAHSHAFILIDIDHFKKFNDEQGHHKGDEVLAKVAKTIMNNTREEDKKSLFDTPASETTNSRLGGEEIGVLVPHISSEDSIKMAEKLRQSVVDETQGEVTVSIGVLPKISLEMSLEANVAMADMALYDAKASGRDQVKVYNPIDHPLPPEFTTTDAS